MPLQATSGAASYDGFGGGVVAEPNYIESCFSTYLYTGNGSTQAITNGIDLSTKGGLVWIKRRATVRNHLLFDTARGVGREIYSNTTDAQNGPYDTLTSFNTTGFSLGTEIDVNASGQTMASWTFRKQPKFFDVVTYTGAGGNTRDIAHNLGSTPGFIIVKSTSLTSGWYCWHNSFAANGYVMLNSTAAATTGSVVFGGSGNKAPTSTTFTVGNNSVVNGAGETYVAYLFAHDAGGFGLTGTDNVISCGSWTGTGSTVSVDLGYEPQWLMFKRTDDVGDWVIVDNMRGFTTTGADAYLKPNTSGAETSVTGAPAVNATGFSWTTGAGTNFIYIAIRRGPMKVPTSGTSVFSPNTATYSANQVVTTGFPVDMLMMKGRTITLGTLAYDRLRGLASTNTSPVDPQLITSDTSAETSGDYVNTANNTGYQISAGFSGFSSVNWNFQRAPSFFDVVCYTGVFTAQTINHNLTVAPEMIITKKRSSTSAWPVYHIGVPSPQVNQPNLNATGGYYANNWYPSAPTSTTFTAQYQDNGSTYVAYLFATCAGVSKVGSYTGTGTTLQVNCGFTGGARFVLIKRTDSTGDWYVWDSARGIVAGNDPYLLLNSTAAEVTNTDYVDTYSAGFEISSTAPAAINASGGTFIFLAIA